MPEGFEVHRIHAEYKKAAVLGDMICPSVSAESLRISVKLCDESGESYAKFLNNHRVKEGENDDSRGERGIVESMEMEKSRICAA